MAVRSRSNDEIRNMVLTDGVDLGRHLLRAEATVRVVDIAVPTATIAAVVLRLGRVHLGPAEFAHVSHFYFIVNYLFCVSAAFAV